MADLAKVMGLDVAAAAPTKEFFVPVTAIQHTGTLGFKGYFAVIEITTGRYYLSFKCPHDFTSLTHCKIIGIKETDGTIDWTASTCFCAIDEVYNANSDSDTADGLAMLNNKLEDVDISAAFTGLAANDYVGAAFIVDAISAGEFKVIGLVFKYN